MSKVRVFRYQVYDIRADDFFVSTRMATEDKIAQIPGARPILSSEREVDASLVNDGWTDKDFRPQ